MEMFKLVTLFVTFVSFGFCHSINQPYFGTYLGNLNKQVHDVSGDAYAVDESTIFIKGFNYDGQGPDAYFWAGSSSKPDISGFIIPDEKGSTKPLGMYSQKDIVLKLPEGKTFREIKWISVWCRKFSVNFGHIEISQNLEIPTPIEIQPLSQLEHGVKSGPITVVDAQTFLITDFHYDGQGPAGYWWASKGRHQNKNGDHLDDENGSQAPLRAYSGETVVISLPDEKTIWDYNWIGVWCEEFFVDFGSTRIPHSVQVPPSPRMLGVKPESKLNCEVLYDQLGYEIRWVMDGDDIVMQLVGKIEPGDYMAFGLSQDDSKSSMIGADAVVTWFDSQGKGHAVDYYLSSKEQCVGTQGSCPDLKFPGASDTITLLHSSTVNNFTLITFKRPQLGVDNVYDQHVYSDGKQAVIWAIGSLNDRQEVAAHRLVSKGDLFIDFARTPQWNCPNSEMSKKTEESKNESSSMSSSFEASTLKPFSASPSKNNEAWEIPPIVCPSDHTFRFQIGPTGGKKGYQSITGKVGWGIAWYVNGLIIPELTVERGKTYTFIVEGGNDKVYSSKRHPLYITDSPEGGFEHKSDDERRSERVFAGIGITRRGELVPTAEGRLCEWKIDTRQAKKPEDFEDFFKFQRTLSLQCNLGEPGILHWKPDKNTPDTVYYQCYAHRYFGWKIQVVDSCDHLASASYVSPVKVPAILTKNSYYKSQNIETSKKGIQLKGQNVLIKKSNFNQLPSHNQDQYIFNINKPLAYISESVQLPDFNINRYNLHQYQRLRPIESSGMLPNLYPIPMNLPMSYYPINPIRPLNMYLSSFYPQTFLKNDPIYLKSSNSALGAPTFSSLKAQNVRSSSTSKLSTPKTSTYSNIKESLASDTIGLNLHGGFVPVLINSKGSAFLNSPRVSEAIEIIPLTDSEINMTQYALPKKTKKLKPVHNLNISNEVHYSIRESKPVNKVNQKDEEKIEYLGYLTEEDDQVEGGKEDLSSNQGKSIPDQVYHAMINDEKGTMRIENIYPIVSNPNHEEVKMKVGSGQVLKTPLELISEEEKKIPEETFDQEKLNQTDSKTEASQSNIMSAYNKIINNHYETKQNNDRRSSPDYEINKSDLFDTDSPDISMFTNKNETEADDTILAHILSLISDKATPPDVKIITHQNGHIHSTNVEIHHKIKKRSPHHSSAHQFELVTNKVTSHATTFKTHDKLIYCIMALIFKLF